MLNDAKTEDLYKAVGTINTSTEALAYDSLVHQAQLLQFREQARRFHEDEEDKDEDEKVAA